jgi:hypothetical protein
MENRKKTREKKKGKKIEKGKKTGRKIWKRR